MEITDLKTNNQWYNNYKLTLKKIVDKIRIKLYQSHDNDIDFNEILYYMSGMTREIVRLQSEVDSLTTKLKEIK